MQANLRRIYFDRFTGNKIVEVGFMGYVTPTTTEQDLMAYSSLSERNPETFDVLELEYEQYAQDFAECNGYRVNSDTKELEFSYPDLNKPMQPPVFEKPLSEQIKALELKTDEAIMELSMVIAMGGTG